MEDLQSYRNSIAKGYASAAREAIGQAPALEGGETGPPPRGPEDAGGGPRDVPDSAFECLDAVAGLAEWILDDVVAAARAYRLDAEGLLRETVGVLADALGLLGSDGRSGGA